MGRELRRVPLDFNWPIDKVWEGFLNPHRKEQIPCPDCKGPDGRPDGYNLAGRILNALWYYTLYRDWVVFECLDMIEAGDLDGLPPGILRLLFDTTKSNESWSRNLDQEDVQALVEAGRLWDFTRRPRSPDQECHENGWTKEPNGYIPTAEEVNRWAQRGMGHDSINQYVCIRARAKRYGIDHLCPTCKGGFTVPDAELEARIEAWKRTPPPTGEGWQLWETVSEGSPVTPVFATPEELADWLVENDTSITRDATREQWLKFLYGPGWAPSAMTNHTGDLVSGVEGMAE